MGHDEIPLRPLIQAHDWPSRAGTLHRSLCYQPRLPGTPWLSFYFEVEGRMNYVGPKILDHFGASAEQLEQGVLQQIECLPASWTPGVIGGRAVLRCLDVPHACERILISSFLEEGRRMLGVRALCATVPQRGMLLAGAFDDAPHLMALGQHYFDHAENPRVSPWVFAIVGGQIAGRFFEENGLVGLDAVTPPTR